MVRPVYTVSHEEGATLPGSRRIRCQASDLCALWLSRGKLEMLLPGRIAALPHPPHYLTESSPAPPIGSRRDAWAGELPPSCALKISSVKETLAVPTPGAFRHEKASSCPPDGRLDHARRLGCDAVWPSRVPTAQRSPAITTACILLPPGHFPNWMGCPSHWLMFNPAGPLSSRPAATPIILDASWAVYAVGYLACSSISR